MWTGERHFARRSHFHPFEEDLGDGAPRAVQTCSGFCPLGLRDPSLLEDNEQRASGRIRETRYQRQREEKRILPEWGVGWGVGSIF